MGKRSTEIDGRGGNRNKTRGCTEIEIEKELKTKIELANQEKVRNECERMRKGRTISKGNWGAKEYMNMEMDEAREIRP